MYLHHTIFVGDCYRSSAFITGNCLMWTMFIFSQSLSHALSCECDKRIPQPVGFEKVKFSAKYKVCSLSISLVSASLNIATAVSVHFVSCHVYTDCLGEKTFCKLCKTLRICKGILKRSFYRKVCRFHFDRHCVF